MSSLKIEIPLAEWQPKSCSSPSSSLKERLQTTPTKDPEELSQALATRNARQALLHKLEIEAKQARAQRASQLVLENRARKVRIESAKSARASAKVEKASKLAFSVREDHEAKREAAAARRTALFEAVRISREERQAAREARLKELSQLEETAFASRQKKIQSTVSRSSAQVKHALEVAANLKEKEKEATATAAAELAARLSAAESRRQDVLTATVEGAAAVGHAAEKVRLRHLQLEKSAIEARKLRLSQAMSMALGRRQTAIESIASRAAAENARVADVVCDAKHQATTVAPNTKRHALAKRLQAAEVNRMVALKKGKTGRVGSALSSPEASPTHSPVGSPQKVAPPSVAPWSADNTVIKMATAPAVIVIKTDEFHYPCPVPSSRLLNRLNFRPKMYLATAPARQAAAAGRRETFRCIIKARANHLGTVRVAVVRGRRAAAAEYARSIFELREKRAAARAGAFLLARAEMATKMLQRVTAAKLRRSSSRLSLLNKCIASEELRLKGSQRREATLEGRKGNADARAFVVKVRRAAAAERLAGHGAALDARGLAATSRRDALLTSIVARARLASTRRLVPAAEATASEAKPKEGTAASADEPTDKAGGAEAMDKAAADKVTTAADKTAADKAAADKTAEVVTSPRDVKPTDEFTLPISSLAAAAADLDARIAEWNAHMATEAKQRISSKAMTHFAELLELQKGVMMTKGEVRASFATWKLLEAKLLEVAKAGTTVDAQLTQQRAEAVGKAADVSDRMAVRAQSRAEAKAAAKAKAKAAAAAVEQVAIKAGLQGAMAKKAAASKKAAKAHEADGQKPSIVERRLSDASLDAEEWQVVHTKM